MVDTRAKTPPKTKAKIREYVEQCKAASQIQSEGTKDVLAMALEATLLTLTRIQVMVNDGTATSDEGRTVAPLTNAALKTIAALECSDRVAKRFTFDDDD